LITYLLGLSFTANTRSQKVITTVTIVDKKAYQGFIKAIWLDWSFRLYWKKRFIEIFFKK